jgi:hypothetical protein
MLEGEVSQGVGENCFILSHQTFQITPISIFFALDVMYVYSIFFLQIF